MPFQEIEILSCTDLSCTERGSGDRTACSVISTLCHLPSSSLIYTCTAVDPRSFLRRGIQTLKGYIIHQLHVRTSFICAGLQLSSRSHTRGFSPCHRIALKEYFAEGLVLSRRKAPPQSTLFSRRLCYPIHFFLHRHTFTNSNSTTALDLTLPGFLSFHTRITMADTASVPPSEAPEKAARQLLSCNQCRKRKVKVRASLYRAHHNWLTFMTHSVTVSLRAKPAVFGTYPNSVNISSQSLLVSPSCRQSNFDR